MHEEFLLLPFAMDINMMGFALLDMVLNLKLMNYELQTEDFTLAT